MLVMSKKVALSATEDATEAAHCNLTNAEETFNSEPNNKASFRTVTSSIPSSSTHSENSLEQGNVVKATVVSGVDDPIYVTVPGPNDVLLGRGAPIINYEGNIRFRALVSTKKMEYVGSGRHQVKDGIAKSIIDEIERRKGRFLRRVDPANVASTEASLGAECEPSGSNDRKANGAGRRPNFVSNKLYQVADYDVAIEKVKQALRDKDTMKQQIDTSDESGASSSHVTTLLHGQQHQQLFNVQNTATFPTVDYGINNNVVGRTHGVGNEDTRNVSNDFIRNQQLRILSMQVQNRLASENLLVMNQHRLQQEENQRYLSGLLNPPPVQSMSIQQQLALLQAGSLTSIASSQNRDNEALVNLQNRQQAELLSLINSSVDGISVAAALLSRNNVMNSYLRSDGQLPSNAATTILEPDHQQLSRFLPGISNQPSYWTAATALGLGHTSGTQSLLGALSTPSYQASALLPIPSMGPILSRSNRLDEGSSDLIGSVNSASMVSSRMPFILGESPQIYDDLKNKSNATSEEKGGSVSKSSSSSTLQSNESSISSGPTSRKKFKAN